MNNEENTMYIDNAGLILLHPYILRYFSLLDLLEENQQFKDENSQQRAVYLIQYLITGQQETAEHLLAFNKILCGLDVETPISLGIEVSEQEMEFAEQLLNSVFQNWDKINHFTVENLRDSFLIRDGKLEEKEEDWELSVEQKAYDILLDSLPWSISVVSLPWMEKRLRCTWK